jgi:hypothetical protein
MSKESLDYSILCPNYYTNWEDGCCMENCTHNDLDLCPIHYVKGLLEDKDHQIKILQKALELACDFNASTACGANCEYCRFQDICIEVGLDANYVNYFVNKAKEMIKSE